MHLCDWRKYLKGWRDVYLTLRKSSKPQGLGVLEESKSFSGSLLGVRSLLRVLFTWSPSQSPESSYRPLSLSPIVQPMSPLQWQDGSWSHEKSCTAVGCPPWGCNVLKSLTAVCKVNLSVSISVVTTSESCIATWLHFEFTIFRWLIPIRQACSPLIQLFFGFASDIDQTNINRDIRDGNWLSRTTLQISTS